MKRFLLILAVFGSAPAHAKPLAEMIDLGHIAEIKSEKPQAELSACIAAAIGWSKHLDRLSVPEGTAYVPAPLNAPVFKLYAGDPLFAFVISDDGSTRTARLYNQKGKGWQGFAAKFSSCGEPVMPTPPAS